MKIAVIGTGGIAQKAYFPLLAVIPDVEIVGVHSRTQKHADEACQRWGFPFATTRLEEILFLKPEAAIVISSTESHYDICRLMLEHGIDVYTEKSLTTSSNLSFDLHKIAVEKECVLAVGFNRRYALLYKQAKEMLGTRKINLAIIQKHRTQASYPSLSEQFLDDTIHQIDLMRFFCGDTQPLTTNYEFVDGLVRSVVSNMQLPGGGQGVLLVCNHAGVWQESATIHAEGMTIHVNAFRSMRVLYEDHEEEFGTDRAGKWITSLKERGFYGELAHFFDCVHTRKSPNTSAEEAAKTQLLLEDLVRASGEEFQA
jgi:virulence factor